MPDFIHRIRQNGGYVSVAAAKQYKMVVSHPGLPLDYGHMEKNGWARVVTCLNGVKLVLSLPEARMLKDWPCTPD
jgi:hypothetical protein